MLCPQVSKRQILADPSRCKILPKLIGLWVDQIDVLRSDGEICGFPNNEVNFPLISQLVMHVTQVYNLMMPGTQIQKTQIPKAQCFTDTYCCQVNCNSTLLICFLTSYFLLTPLSLFLTSSFLLTLLPPFWPISCQTWNLSKNLAVPIFGRKNFTHRKRVNWDYFCQK